MISALDVGQHWRVIFAAIIIVVFLALPANAAMRTDELMWKCDGRDTPPELGMAYCVGYLGGVNDLNAIVHGMMKTGFFCVPGSGVSNDQLRLVFLKWAREHPEQLHKGARSSVLISLMQAFPCKKQK